MHPFRDFSATNKAATCLWCGRALRHHRHRAQLRQGKLGDYADGFFCGLRCGYDFAVTLALKGDRLRAKAIP